MSELLRNGAAAARTLRALERSLAAEGTHAPADLWAMVEDRTAQVWGDERAAVVTELVDYPLRTVLRFWVVAGELERCVALEPSIIAWGRAQGASEAQGLGRPGFARVLAPHGWRPAGLRLKKDI